MFLWQLQSKTPRQALCLGSEYDDPSGMSMRFNHLEFLHFGRRFRRPILRALLATFCCCQILTWNNNALGQGNPFEDAGAAAPNKPKPTIVLSDRSGSRVGETTQQLLLRTIASSNPQTPFQLCRSIKVLLDVKEYQAANTYLAQLAEIEIDAKAAYELNDAIGSDFFFRLARLEPLQPAGRQQATTIFGLATQWANSRERIDGLLDEMASDSIIVRSEAFERLRRIGSPAVARILESFVNPDREDEYPRLRGALYRFDSNVVPVLMGGANSDLEPIQYEAIRALAGQNSVEALDEVLWARVSPNTSDRIKEVADAALQRAGVSTDLATVENRLVRRIGRFLSGRRISSDNLEGDLRFWSWNAETKQLNSTEVDAETGVRVRGAQLARTLYRMNPQSAANRRLLLLSELEVAKRSMGPSRPIDVDEFLKNTPNVTAGEINLLIGEALKLDLIPAAIGCCEVLKKTGDRSLVQSSPRCALVEALLTGDRYLQFAAFDAIATLDPQSSFAGSSYVADFATYIASSRFERAALVGSGRQELGRAIASSLTPLKWSGDVALNTKEVFEVAARNPDIEVLLLSDGLTSPRVRELVQQLRSNWKTRRLPIGILADSEQRLIKSTRLTVGTDRLLTFPQVTEPEFLARQLMQLQELQQPWSSVSSDDRFQHAKRSLDWLQKVSLDPRYSFYSIPSYQDRIVGWLYHPEFTEATAEILAGSPTVSAQKALIRFISRNELPVEARSSVVDAFAKSVKNSGNLLTVTEVDLQYDRYNASESQSKEIQEIYGRVLDIIEAAQ